MYVTSNYFGKVRGIPVLYLKGNNFIKFYFSLTIIIGKLNFPLHFSIYES